MSDFSNVRVIYKNEYFKAFATKICDVAPLALHMLLCCLSCLFEDTRANVTVVMTLIFLIVCMLQLFLMKFHHHLDFSKNLANAVD